MATNLHTEFDYYQRNKAEIRKKYLGRYIVIVGEEIIGDYDSQLTAIKQTMRTHKLGTFMVKGVELKDKILYFGPRFKLVR